MRVLVTRPAAQARDWVRQLQERGIDAAALPLIAIAPPADPAPLVAAWQALAQRHLVVFVSPNAVDGLFALRPPGAAWPAGTLAASPGPGTGAALRVAGVPADCIVEPAADAPQFDSESLWAVLGPRCSWGGGSALIVRGGAGTEAQGSGREWLVQRLRESGVSVDTLAAYRRAAPQLDAGQRALLRQALDAPAAHAWLFSSSEAIDQLEALVPATPQPWSAAQAVATHPRIAARARTAGFGHVVDTPPSLAAVAEALRSLHPRR
ncbi:uroporphyrinogen-III synthase [uncultured Methylibium sp.]|uniref:uroporphyrinogen-III synthase n=1 Tax=uncultured Methylibium sp. TaxID=381093 RepID=UPI0025DE9DB1|nr:uroporphyrinogen-III synthase [uncultured Methylibium sp.]